MVSPIGLGTVKLGRNTGVKYPSAFELPDDGAAIGLLEQAAALGITLIDTAPAYGSSEERLGALLPRVGGRDRWVICTKAGERYDPESGSSFDYSARSVTGSVESSLRRLRTDRLDIVLLHSGGDDAHVIERSGGLEALEALKRQGKVLAVGVSTKTPAGALLAARRCDVVMLTLGPSSLGDLEAVKLAGERGVGVLVKKALNSGHAADPVAAIRYCLRTPGVSSVIVGTINPRHLSENAAAAAGTG